MRWRRRRAFVEGSMIITIAIMIVAVPAMLPGMGKIAIEYFLLIGCQHGADLAEALPEQLMPLVIVVLPRFHHFEPRIAQDIADLIALRRRQIELEIHSLDQARSRHVQITIPVRHRTQRETNQQARDSNNQAEPDIRLSWQDRSLSEASPAPMGRWRFQASSLTRVPIAPRL